MAKRLVEEPGGEAVERLCRDATSLSVSILCYTEILSALIRRLLEKKLARSRYSRLKENLFNDLTDAEIVLISTSVLTTSIRLLERIPLRTLDALQIACAVEWEGGTLRHIGQTSDGSGLRFGINGSIRRVTSSLSLPNPKNPGKNP